MNEGLIFADGRMLTATEAAAYIKELKEENEKLRIENKKLKTELEDIDSDGGYVRHLLMKNGISLP